MKLRDFKRRHSRRLHLRARDLVSVRLRRLEQQVIRGERDARSLLTIPADLARNVVLRYPPGTVFQPPSEW